MGKHDGSDSPRLEPIPFEETAGADVFNASELVPLDDSRFLFCDNNINDALFEFELAADGSLAGPLRKHPVRGLPAASVDDMEGMALVEDGSQRWIFVTPSLSLKIRDEKAKKKRKRGEEFSPRNGLLRIRVSENGELDAEIVPDFRAWVLEHFPVIGKPARWIPDDGGLNVEGLSWDPAARALVLGLRTPVLEGRPLLLPVRVRDLAGPWTLENLEALEPVSLQVDDGKGEFGVRSIEYDPVRGETLVILGNARSGSKVPFGLYSWDGNAEGRIRRFPDVRFGKRMKAEGVARGTIGGRDAVVFVDDGGGYQFLWADDPRLGRVRE